jgi:two-component system sensor histidine kinase PilS (NtrC family)
MRAMWAKHAAGAQRAAYWANTVANSPVPQTQSATADLERTLRRELHFFILYRLFEAALLALAAARPLLLSLEAPLRPRLALATAAAYVLAALALWLWSRRPSATLHMQVLVGLGVDILAAFLALHALPAAGTAIVLLLLLNLGAGSLLLAWRAAAAMTATAAFAVIGAAVWTWFSDGRADRSIAELVLLLASTIGAGALGQLLRRQMLASHALAAERGAEAESLTEINELVIRRMRTGVLVLEGDRIRLANEAAAAILGDGGDSFALALPDVARRLAAWRVDGNADTAPLRLGAEQAEFIPRFVRLPSGHERVLVFLDDASMVARRAESLTLAALGRFSASLAHEIRNPLAAISYAAQLLDESDGIPVAERRMLQIIQQQCQRMDGIVESVLGLARREHAKAEPVELAAFVQRYVEDFSTTLAEGNGHLLVEAPAGAVDAVVDPGHLQQVLTILVQNALRYGRMPGQPADVRLTVRLDAGLPLVQVCDRGPGIPESVAAQLFRPFFTTSEHGTGLGLYIARELCRANQATLDHVPVPGGGACFRLRLAALATPRHAR